MNDENKNTNSEKSIEARQLELRKKLVDLIHHPAMPKEAKDNLCSAVKKLID